MVTEDRIWGFVLIAAGLASLAFHPFDRLNMLLGAAADETLTMVLVLIAAVMLVTAVKAPIGTKVLMVAWVVTP